MYRHRQEVMLRIAITRYRRPGEGCRPARPRLPSLASDVSDGTAARLPQAGRTLADLLPERVAFQRPGAEAGGLTGRMETHRVRGLRCIGQLARMRGGAFEA